MDWSDQGKQLLGEFHPRKFFAGWLRALLLAGLVAVIAFLNGAGPLLITLVIFVVALLSFWVLDKATDRTAARGVTVGLAILGVAVLGWSAWEKHKAAAKYELAINDYTVWRAGRPLPTGEGQVTAINAVLDLANTYDFPLYYRIERRYAKIGREASRLDNPGASIEPLEPRRSIFINSDLIPAVLENGKYHEVQVEFEVLYGKTERLEKRFRYTAKWQFFLCPKSALLCGPVTSTEEKITNSRNDTDGS